MELRQKTVARPGKKRGFIEYERGTVGYRAIGVRMKDWKEIVRNTPFSLWQHSILLS